MRTALSPATAARIGGIVLVAAGLYLSAIIVVFVD